MAMGIVNVPGVVLAGGGTPIDTESTVSFRLGCDENGVYIVTPDDEDGEGEGNL